MYTDRATLDELLEFANRVRAAGAGNPLDALMPSIPVDPTACLIARNLNFNCAVNKQETWKNQYGRGVEWVMVVEDKDLADKIAKELGLRVVPSDDKEGWAVVLPERIGAVAEAFDKWDDLSYDLDEFRDACEIARSRKVKLPAVEQYVNTETLEWLKEFAPYVESAEEEAKAIGRLNERGQLVI